MQYWRYQEIKQFNTMRWNMYKLIFAVPYIELRETSLYIPQGYVNRNISFHEIRF